MWTYERRLIYPVRIACRDGGLGDMILDRYFGCPDECMAPGRYMMRRHIMPCEEAVATLCDIATEELAHMELVFTIAHQLKGGLSAGDCAARFEEAVTAGREAPPCDDPMGILNAEMEAKQRTRALYEELALEAGEESVAAPLRFLRQREVIHSQRIGEALRIIYSRFCGECEG